MFTHLAWLAACRDELQSTCSGLWGGSIWARMEEITHIELLCRARESIDICVYVCVRACVFVRLGISWRECLSIEKPERAATRLAWHTNSNRCFIYWCQALFLCLFFTFFCYAPNKKRKHHPSYTSTHTIEWGGCRWHLESDRRL